MLVTFKSKAAAEIYMYAEHAKMLLDLIGKPFEPPQAPMGVITVEQLPAALAALRGAAEHATHQGKEALRSYEASDQPGDPLTMPVSLAQRAYPLMDMLERAEKKGAVVTWGV